MSDLNDLSRPVVTDTEPNVLDTLRAHIVRAATWAGWSGTANRVAGIMSGVSGAVSGGRSLRLYRRNDANTADEEVVQLPGISVGGNAASASAAQAGSTLQTVLDAKAPLASPALTGTPTAPTAAAGSATGQIANTAFVATAVANVINTSPAALDTLNELAAALGNDPNFAGSMTMALGNRVVRVSAARPGVTKLYRNDGDDAFNVQTNWMGARWRLKGYSGDTFHAEVEVGYADVAGTAGSAGYATSAGSALAVPWAGVSGRPTALSQLTNDVGYITSVSWSGVSGRPTGLSQFNNDAGYITSAPVPNTTNVLAATAGASVGTVGTYAFLGRKNSTTDPGNVVPGQTVAGSTLFYAPGLSGSAVSGTWRAMGSMTATFTPGDYSAGFFSSAPTLFLRIS